MKVDQCLFISSENHSPFAGQQGVLHELFRAGDRLRLREMIGQFCGVGLDLGAIQRFQSLGDTGMDPDLACGRQLAGKCLLNQRVRPHDDVRAAVADRLDGVAPLLRLRRAGQQHDADLADARHGHEAVE